MPHAPLLILIADDEKAIVALLCTIFEDEGYHVYACHSGKAAAKAIEHLHPDLAILDMQMEQRWSGLEVVQHMCDNPTLKDIPVIIYSANNLCLDEVRDKLMAHRCQIPGCHTKALFCTSLGVTLTLQRAVRASADFGIPE